MGMKETIVKMSKAGYLIRVTNSVKKYSPKNKSDYTLEEAQKGIGGDIEVVYPMNQELSKEGIIGIAREDAYGCRFNNIASMIFGYPLFGDVILCMDNMLR